jgi:hypothetical protein
MKPDPCQFPRHWSGLGEPCLPHLWLTLVIALQELHVGLRAPARGGIRSSAYLSVVASSPERMFRRA